MNRPRCAVFRVRALPVRIKDVLGILDGIDILMIDGRLSTVESPVEAPEISSTRHR